LESESELPPPKRLFTVSRFLFLGLLGGLLFVLAWNTVSEARPLNADSAVQSGGAGAFLMAGVGLWVGLIGAFQFTLLKCVFFAFDPEEFQDYTRTHARFSERVKVLSNALDRTWFTRFGGWLFSSLLFILSGFAYLILWQATERAGRWRIAPPPCWSWFFFCTFAENCCRRFWRYAISRR
jgi:hypothetical protein